MRYNELDLTQLLPDGHPLNEADRVESKGYINAFFLRAFEWWYREFSHYAISYAAPYSLEACMSCTQSELQRFIEEAGCIFYNGNSIETNATFTNSLYTIPLGTDGIINAITQYIFNSRAVTGTVDYTGLQAHHYRIIAEGELESGEITPEVMARFDAILNNFVPVTEKIDGFTLREAVELTANLTDIAVNPLRCCEIELEIPEIPHVLFFTINKSTGEETRGNGIFEPVMAAKDNAMFSNTKQFINIPDSANLRSVAKDNAMFSNTKQAKIVDFGQNLIFTISNTPVT